MTATLAREPGKLTIDLPEPFVVMDIAGQSIFPVYSATGGLMGKSMLVVLREEDLAHIDGSIQLPVENTPWTWYANNGHPYASIWFTEDMAELQKRATDAAFALSLALGGR
jgi:hypothetical protein